ncbi:MAG TPA: YbhB/YbcL family Raf kinase inhibitor-like protein [Opitutaceae bacterium]|nr:YbhB/YbcL family Raf kinase inhibitor-like protein [Opitutaceae bacterium]
MNIESSAFKNGGTIPSRYAKRGGNVSPPLALRDVPRDAKTLVLVVEDPDAPHREFTHWVVFNIDPAGWFPEGKIPPGARQARNGWGEAAYGGPQPPDGEHRYFFRVRALDCALELPEGVDREEVERAVEGHVLAQAELVGLYAPDVGGENESVRAPLPAATRFRR